MKTLRIAHVVSTSPPYEGGMGTVVLNLARELAKNPAYEVDVVTLKESFKFQITNSKFQIKSNDQNPKIIKLHPWIRWGNAGLVPQLLWRLRKYDIVHLHYAFFGGAEFILFAKLLGLLKAKLVIHYHNDVVGVGIVRPIAWLDEALFLKALFKSADAVVALSEFHLKHSKRLSQYHNIIQNKLHILPNGIDPELFSPRNKDPELMARFNIPADSTVVMYTGAIDNAHYFKGVDDLIRAFQLAYQRNPKLFLLIIGGGDREKYMRELAHQLLVAGSYVFTGSVANPEMPRHMSLGNMFVLPSFEVESFGIVLIEALAMGKTVIASDLPSLDEVVRDDTIGLRFKRRDVNDLAEKILEMGRRCTAGVMGVLGRQYVVETYSWEKIGKKLDEIYKSL